MITEEIQRKTLQLLKEYTGGESARLEGLLSYLDAEEGAEGQIIKESRKMLFRMATSPDATYDIVYSISQEIQGALEEAKDALQSVLYGNDGVLRWSPATRNPPPDRGELEDVLSSLQSVRRNNLTETVVEGLGDKIKVAAQALANFSESSEPNLVQVLSAEELRALKSKLHFLQFLVGRFLAIETEVRSVGIHAAATATSLSQLSNLLEVAEAKFPEAAQDKGLSEELVAQLVALLSVVQLLSAPEDIFGELISPDATAKAVSLYSEMVAEAWLDPVDGSQELLGVTVTEGSFENKLASPIRLVFPGNQVPLAPSPQGGDILLALNIIRATDVTGSEINRVYTLPAGYTEEALEGVDVFFLAAAAHGPPVGGSWQRGTQWVPHADPITGVLNRILFPGAAAMSATLWLQVRSVPGTTALLYPEGPDVFSTSWSDFPLELRSTSGAWLLRADLNPNARPPAPTELLANTMVSAPSAGTEVLRALDPTYTDGTYTSVGFSPDPDIKQARIGDVVVLDSLALPITKSWGQGFVTESPFPRTRSIVGGEDFGQITPGEEDLQVEVGLFTPLRAGSSIYAFPDEQRGTLPIRAEFLGWDGTGVLSDLSEAGDPPLTFEKLVLCPKGDPLPSYRMFSSGKGYEVNLDYLSDYFSRGTCLHPRILRGMEPVEMSVHVEGRRYPALNASLNHLYIPGEVLPLGAEVKLSGSVRGGVKVAELLIPVDLDPLDLGDITLYGGATLYDLKSRRTWEVPYISVAPSGEIIGSLSQPLEGSRLGPLSYGGPVAYGPFGRASHYLKGWSFEYEKLADALQRAAQSLGATSLGTAGSCTLTLVPGEGFSVTNMVGDMDRVLGCEVVPVGPGVSGRDVKGFPVRAARVSEDTGYLLLTGIPRGAAAGVPFDVRFSSTWISTAYQEGLALEKTYLGLTELMRTIHPSSERWYAALGRSAEARGDMDLAQRFREYRVAEILQGTSSEMATGSQIAERLAGLLDEVKGE